MLKLLIFWCTRRSGTGAHSDQSLLHINIAWPAGLLGLPAIATILLQAAVMAGAYLGLARAFKVEALAYLVATAGELVGFRRARG